MTVGDRLGGGRNNLTKGFKVFADFLARFILLLLWQLSTSGPRCGYISLAVRRVSLNEVKTQLFISIRVVNSFGYILIEPVLSKFHGDLSSNPR